MAKSCKYYKQQRQVSYDNGVTWINLEEYRQGALIEVNSSDCTSPSTRIYRWAKAGTDDYVCVGYDKHYKEYYQYSTDNGRTWQNVVPTSSRTSNDVIEYNSVDCGVTPQYIYRWVKTDITTCVENTDFKFKANYNNSTSYSAECNSSSELTSGETRPNGYTYAAMTSAEIGDCVTSIGDGTFAYCISLTSIDIPDSVTSMGEETFSYCYALTNASIGSGLTNISNWAFSYCTSLTSVTIPDSVTSIGKYAFNECSGLTSIIIPDSVTSIGEWAFDYCSSLSSCTIGSCVTSIGEWAFAYCSGLTSIVIPDSVTSIDVWTFNECSSLTNCTIGSGVTSIDTAAFRKCFSLASIVIPDSVTSISNAAFQECSGLTSVIIGSGVTTIGNSAFIHCSSLTSVTVNAVLPPTIELGSSSYYYVFYDTNNCPIYVPAASVETYKSASGWSTYADRIQAIP